MFDETYDHEKSGWTKSARGIGCDEGRGARDEPGGMEGPATKKGKEDRCLQVGKIGDRLWAIGFTYRKEGIRIFTVRPARKDEKDVYDGR